MNRGARLLRLRFELDSLLRRRAFVARAVNGRLDEGEYAELLGQFGALFKSLDSPGAARLAGLALADASAFGHSTSVTRAFGEPCHAVRFFRAVCQEPATRLGTLALEASIAITATSWVHDAREELTTRYPGATAFFDALGDDAHRCVDRVARRVECDELVGSVVCAFAELKRGAILGVEGHLDSMFPAPVVSFRRDATGAAGVRRRGQRNNKGSEL